MITVNGVKITDYRRNVGRKYVGVVIASYKASNGTTYNITAGKLIDSITEDFKAAARLYNKTGLDDALSESKAFNKALLGQLGYTGAGSVSGIIKGFVDVWNTGKSSYGSFKNAVSDENKAAIEWALKNPGEYVGGLIDYGETGTIPTGAGTGILSGDMSGILKYLLLGLGIVLIIKGIRKNG